MKPSDNTIIRAQMMVLSLRIETNGFEGIVKLAGYG